MAPISYAELHCLSNFSFLRGASHPEGLVAQAAELGYAALAITDRNSLAGVVRAHVAAREHNREHPDRPIRLIIGAEITPTDAPPVVLLATDRAAYGRLSRLITRGRVRCKKGECELRLADIGELTEGLIAVVIPEGSGFGVQGSVESHAGECSVAAPYATLDATKFVSPSGATVNSRGREPPVSRPAQVRAPERRRNDWSLPALGLSPPSGALRKHRRGPGAHAPGYSLPPRPGLKSWRNAESVASESVASESLACESLACASGSVSNLPPRSLDPLIPRSIDPSIPWSPDSLAPYRRLFPSNHLFLAAEFFYDQPDTQRLAALAALSEETGIPLVAANAVHYHIPQRRYLQDVLTCIREKCTIATAGWRLFANAERHLRPLDEIERRYTGFAAAPYAGVPHVTAPNAAGRENAELARLSRIGREALARTIEIAQRCTFSLDELRYDYPHELVPAGVTPMEHLRRLTQAGARERYPDGIPDVVRKRIEQELQLIEELRYEHYFLTVWDLVHFARARDILCQGRGSAANSAVCYCLGVTAVDPARHDLLFERFICRERGEPPDIDIDFEHERREEVFQYIYAKYGRERAAITAEVISYRPRSAVRDVGKALGLSLERVDRLAKSQDWWSEEAVSQEALREAGVDPRDRTIQMLIRLVRQILGFPRHLSQHVGGFVITESPLCEIVPLENGAMPGRTFIEWDKDDIDALGILKVDCLALGMLTAIHKCFDIVERSAGRNLALHTLPPEDPVVYDMIDRADTVGVFQIESRAQMSMLPRLKPRNFYDLVIEVAIVRPGPIQGGMVHPYLRRRHGLEPITYPSEAVRGVLEKTLGVPLFQEQVMRLAVVAAGFTPGEADQLRRAMAAWRRNGQIEKFQIKLVQGMLERGYPRQFAEQIYNQIRGFGEYGFPESHAASFALLVYASAWLKCYYPAAFAAAVINSQPMGFYSPSQLVRDAQEHGVRVLPVDVNFSGWDCNLEGRGKREERTGNGGQGTGNTKQSSDNAGPALRLGLRLVRGVGEEKIKGILAARAEALFIRSIHELACYNDVSRETLLRLAAADAFGSLGLSRRQAVWQILALDREPPAGAIRTCRREQPSAWHPAPSGHADANSRRHGTRHPDLRNGDATLSLFAELEPQEPPAALPEMTLDETVVQDYDSLGLSLNAHPIELVREELTALRVAPNEQLRTARRGQKIAVAGLVTCRQHPSTARGTVFITLEDETAAANLIIRPNIWEKYARIGRSKMALIAEGAIERQGEVVHVMVSKLSDLSERLGALRTMSRAFH